MMIEFTEELTESALRTLLQQKIVTIMRVENYQI